MSAPAAVFQRAIESNKRSELETLDRLDHAFVVQPEDLVGAGLGDLVSLIAEILQRVAELIRDGRGEASHRALTEVVEPFLRGAPGYELEEGWEQRAEAAVAFYDRQARERLELHAQLAIAELRWLFEEAEQFGWSSETLEATLVDEFARPGRRIGPLRTACRAAVAAVLGHAWTMTWSAAWAGLAERAAK